MALEPIPWHQNMLEAMLPIYQERHFQSKSLRGPGFGQH